jgi:glycine/D-amino acid oxidase-like deaminating enzyme
MTSERDTPQHQPITRRNFLVTGAVTTGAIAAGGFALAACGDDSKTTAGTSTTTATAVEGAEVRSITPPKLTDVHLGRHIRCYRPQRAGSPNMSVEQIGTKLVAHNYGHGGSGWTLGPGTTQYVVDLAEQSPQGRGLAKDHPITVIGAGVIGLFTAYELVQRGYTAVTVVAASFDNLTSHNAGGLLAPVSMDNGPEIQALIDRIGIDAYRFYAEIARGEHPEFAGGARILPTYFENREESGLEPYVGSVMQPAKDVVLDFGNGTRRPMVAYDDGIFFDPATMMDALTTYLTPRTTFETRSITSYDEVASDVVFDCTGLGARDLNDDKKMLSVQGHLIMLKDQNPADLGYMILVYFGKDHTPSGQTVKRSFYIFPKLLTGGGPKDVGVIGGTFIEGGSPATPNTAEFEIMMRGARDFYGI